MGLDNSSQQAEDAAAVQALLEKHAEELAKARHVTSCLV